MTAPTPPRHPRLLPSLWLLRHAAPQIAPGICYGQLDVTVSAVQTQQAAKNFAAVAPQHAIMRSSPLQRCELLALATQALRPDLVLQPSYPRLGELDFGRWEGVPWNDIAPRQLDAWAQQLAHYRPGGGENLHAMLQRVAQALAHSWASDSAGGQRHCLWVCHAGTMRCVQWLLQQGLCTTPHSAQWVLPAPGYGQWLRLPWSALPLDVQQLATGC